MAILRAQINFPSDTGLPEDTTQNTLHFEADNRTISTPLIHDAIEDFFQGVGSLGSIAGWLSSRMAPPATVKYYDLSELPPRVPYSELSLALAVGSGALPEEVALVLSFQAAPVSGVNQARRRNRIYLGPWSDQTFNPLDGQPNGSLVTTVREAAIRLLGASTAAVDWSWVARSETLGTAAVVTNGWVDNAWDTQRRRGIKATTRNTWPA